MKQIVLPTAFALALAIPAQADETSNDHGFSLMEEGARLLFKGLVEEMEPALREMEGLSEQLEPALRGFLENMGPQLGDFLGQVEDFSQFHAPEILPNGDIIMRRKKPTDKPAPDGEVDL